MILKTALAFLLAAGIGLGSGSPGWAAADIMEGTRVMIPPRDAHVTCYSHAGETIFSGRLRYDPESLARDGQGFSISGMEMRVVLLSEGISSDCRANRYQVSLLEEARLFCASGIIRHDKKNWKLGETDACGEASRKPVSTW